MKGKHILVTGVMLVLLAAACGGGAAGPATPTPTLPEMGPTPTPDVVLRIEVENRRFTPNVLTAKKGQIVRVVVYSADSPHTFTIDELDVEIQVRARGTGGGQFLVPEAKEYVFYCRILTPFNHRGEGEEGILRVVE